MKRLFTFGCSYTRYYWPTWADLLSIEFEHSENWGYTGIGNQAIAERLAECDARNRFTKDDVVIIQWTSYLRHDWYHTHDLPNGRDPKWKTFGGIFSRYNKEVFDDKWIEMFFHEPAYVMHTLNYIKLTQKMLDSIGCTWYMTGMGDIRNLGRDLTNRGVYGEAITGAPAKTNEDDVFPIWKENPDFQFYEQSIWNDHPDKWLTPLYTFLETMPNNAWWFKDENGRPWRESHLSTKVHALWVEKELGNKLSLSKSTISEIANIISGVEDLKNQNDQMFDLCEKLGPNKENVKFNHSENFDWPPEYRGF